MMPPARTSPADPLEARGVHLRGEAARVGEAVDRLRQVASRPPGSPASGRGPARSGRTRASRRSRTAAARGSVNSRMTSLPPGRRTRAISRRPRSRSAKLRTPKPTVTASKRPGVVGKLQRVGPLEADRCRRRARAAFSRARSSIGSEKSQPTTWPPGETRPASSKARSPVPQQTSRAESPGLSSARSAARSPPAVVEARRSSPS